jgi:hypothetical protein
VDGRKSYLDITKTQSIRSLSMTGNSIRIRIDPNPHLILLMICLNTGGVYTFPFGNQNLEEEFTFDCIL